MEKIQHPLDMSAKKVITDNITGTIGALIFVSVAYGLLKSWIDAPITFMGIWTSHGSMASGLQAVWFIFAWAIGLTLLTGLFRAIRKEPRTHEPSRIFVKGTWLGLNAGFFEEIVYRWLMLFGAMITIKFFNIVTFGLVKWLYTIILIPLANWASFGLLDPQLGGAYGWLFAAAIVSANVQFRKGHEYLGLFGMINSWYLGLIMFYLVFNYGLWTAIVAHILYNLCIFWARSLTASMQPRNHMKDLVDKLVSQLFPRY